jgi:hypothetical protein
VQASAPGFGPGSSGEAIFASDPVRVATFVADERGVASVSFQVPATAEPGLHHVLLQGVDARGAVVQVSLPISVTEAAALPLTGGPVGVLSVVGIGFIGFGLVLLGRSWSVLEGEQAS